MKRVKPITIVLNIIIIVLLILSAVSSSFVLYKKDRYMDEKEQAQRIGEKFYEDTSTILGKIGEIVTFEDAYPDQKVLTDTGQTVEMVKEMYERDNKINDRFKDIIENSFYYTIDN